MLLSSATLRPRLGPQAIAEAAAMALRLELGLDPKPGLVSFTTSGSHSDMDAATFERSIAAIRPYFAELAAAGAAGAGFETLRRLGVAAERDMLDATGGINTHRGAIFTLGLLAAAAGGGVPPSPTGLGPRVRWCWGDDLRAADLRAADRRAAPSHGTRAGLRYGVGGARAEAAAGFPTLIRTAWPAFARARATGATGEAAAVEALFAIIAVLDDTNLLHRGGADGLAFARSAAQRFLAAGGVAAPGWRARAEATTRAFVARRLSPGGAADMLAATLFAALLSGVDFRPWA